MMSKEHRTVAEQDRAKFLAAEQLHSIHQNLDRLFAYLMIAQWIAGIAAAIFISPKTWAGAASQTHLHVWLAIGLGGAITSLPVWMAKFRPGQMMTRHVVAIGQMLMSALLIHLSGGRIETHFHIFGSLAFLACYRDIRVLMTATVVVVIDHALRGIFWPESVYGLINAGSLRFFEHAGWVLFEDIFLCITINQSLAEMRRVAQQQARLESTNVIVEQKVLDRTTELRRLMKEVAMANDTLADTVVELEERNKELDQFTYVASHDLQEPVRKLVSFSSLLEEDLDCELNENAKRDLEFITDAAKRMKNLVQALLELSRVGRAAMHHESVDISACIDVAIESLSLKIDETNAVIVRDEMPTVNGDRTMLTQLYQNLISNALKFVDGKPHLHLTAQADLAGWTLGVKDNGIGMKPEYAERIFQPFQRLHNRGEYEGTGIGLSICSKTVQRHGGQIWVESEVGQGAHFQFSIPDATTSLRTQSSSTNDSNQLTPNPDAAAIVPTTPLTNVGEINL